MSSQVEVTSLDENSMKRMVLSIEKRINENMQMRTKYGDKPERFMDSELELYQELKRLHVLATAPELYPTFVRTRCEPPSAPPLPHPFLPPSPPSPPLPGEYVYLRSPAHLRGLLLSPPPDLSPAPRLAPQQGAPQRSSGPG